ncbi:hypothetical protein FRAHR75_1850004 [Frankia sp. Hr75.2]|nr:hypothetical protein FRAHR75_1850004 [Frankia sp. Hr75.2]SQD95038.1 hypothetical protein FMEAI12_2910001 [Parafrankia sp. Ea1.12]
MGRKRRRVSTGGAATLVAIAFKLVPDQQNGQLPDATEPPDQAGYPGSSKEEAKFLRECLKNAQEMPSKSGPSGTRTLN